MFFNVNPKVKAEILSLYFFKYLQSVLCHSTMVECICQMTVKNIHIYKELLIYYIHGCHLYICVSYHTAIVWKSMQPKIVFHTVLKMNFYIAALVNQYPPFQPSFKQHLLIVVQTKVYYSGRGMIELFSLAEIWQQYFAALP